MLFVPLPFVVALLICLLIPRTLGELDDSPAPVWFAALLGLYALLATLVGLRWGYGLTALLPLQSVLAACWAPLAWLSFRGVGRPGAFFDARRDWPHGLPPVIVCLCIALWPAPIDGFLIATFAGYGAALLRCWRRGPDALPAVRLGELVQVHRALGITGGVLIAFALVDVLVSLDVRLNAGRHAAGIVTWASLPMLLFVGYGASVAGTGRSDRPASDPAVDAPVVPDGVPVEAPRAVLDAGPTGDGPDPDEDRRTLETVRAALHRDGLFRDADLTLERIARRSGVSARRVSGAINRLTGDSVSRYVGRSRLDDVRRRLVESDASITEIMLDAGFRTKSNFNRTFREAEGCSPSEWRAVRRASNDAPADE